MISWGTVWTYEWCQETALTLSGYCSFDGLQPPLTAMTANPQMSNLCRRESLTSIDCTDVQGTKNEHNLSKVCRQNNCICNACITTILNFNWRSYLLRWAFQCSHKEADITTENQPHGRNEVNISKHREEHWRLAAQYQTGGFPNPSKFKPPCACCVQCVVCTMRRLEDGEKDSGTKWAVNMQGH